MLPSVRVELKRDLGSEAVDSGVSAVLHPSPGVPAASGSVSSGSRETESRLRLRGDIVTSRSQVSCTADCSVGSVELSVSISLSSVRRISAFATIVAIVILPPGSLVVVGVRGREEVLVL